MPHINILAVLVAAASTFLLGGLWYSPVLFGPTWQRAAGDMRKGHPARVFGVSFGFALLAAIAYALVMRAQTSAAAAITQGLVVGACLVATSFGINYQFANRPTVMWLIDGGYHTVQFGIYGAILGLWR